MFNLLLFSLLAATANNPADSVSRNVLLDEVEVISTVKENTSMRQQPSSVSLIPANQLADNHITSLKGVSSLVPNFFMPDYGSRLTSAVYIRGVGSRMNTPAVGLYVDNVPYVDKSAFDFHFYDVERVDVLRGPQGTLYGRNAMGGLIRVYTKNPFSYEGTDVNLGYATGDNHRTVALTHYHRPSQQFAFSAGGYYEGGDGFFDNVTTGKKADHIQAGGGRWRGILKTSDRLSFDLTASYDYSNEGAYPYKCLDEKPWGIEWKEHFDKISNNREATYRRSLLNMGLNIEYKAPAFVMNAITGYQHLNDRMFLDQDFIAMDLYTLEQKQRINTLTEEITFKNAEKGKWEWVSGVNMMYQTLHTTGPVTFYDDGLRFLEGNINSNMPDVMTIPSLSRMGFTKMSMNFRGDELVMGGRFDTPMLNAAVFHQSTLHLSDKFSAILGLRLDYERMQMKYNAPATVDYGFLLENPRAAMMQVDLQDLSSDLLYAGKLKNDYLKVLPKAALKYDFNANNSIYASVAMGQRSGGYNVQMFSDLLQGAMQNALMKGIQSGVEEYLQKFTAMGMPESVISSVTQTMKDNMPVGEDPTVEQVVYRPEYSWNYEIGTHLGTRDNSFRMDAAVYYMDTRDQQIARFAESGLGRQMVNAGKSESYGAELALRWLANRHILLSGSYGYTHSKFKEYDGGKDIDYSGNYVPFVPMHNVNLDAAYSWYLSGWAKAFTIGASYNGNGRVYWTESNNASQKFYSLLNARMVLEAERFNVTLWAKNLTDTKYDSFFFESAGRQFHQSGRPFQLGIDLRLKL